MHSLGVECVCVCVVWMKEISACANFGAVLECGCE